MKTLENIGKQFAYRHCIVFWVACVEITCVFHPTLSVILITKKNGCPLYSVVFCFCSGKRTAIKNACNQLNLTPTQNQIWMLLFKIDCLFFHSTVCAFLVKKELKRSFTFSDSLFFLQMYFLLLYIDYLQNEIAPIVLFVFHFGICTFIANASNSSDLKIMPWRMLFPRRNLKNSFGHDKLILTYLHLYIDIIFKVAIYTGCWSGVSSKNNHYSHLLITNLRTETHFLLPRA